MYVSMGDMVTVQVGRITNYTFKEIIVYTPTSEPKDNLLIINNKNMLGWLLLLLYIIIPDLPKHLALKININ